jgi:hypothetical protein
MEMSWMITETGIVRADFSSITNLHDYVATALDTTMSGDYVSNMGFRAFAS